MKFSPTQPKAAGATTDMDTLGGEQPGSCRIRVFPNIWQSTNVSDDDVKVAFAHELFHCIQSTWNPDFSADGYNAEWLIEGSATFASFDLYRSTNPQSSRYEFDGWFTTTAAPLIQSSY
ncbi:MAG: hypothetical protein ABIQ39_01410, partial [Ilumatobacteraceae bacterium]